MAPEAERAFSVLPHSADRLRLGRGRLTVIVLVAVVAGAALVPALLMGAQPTDPPVVLGALLFATFLAYLLASSSSSYAGGLLLDERGITRLAGGAPKRRLPLEEVQSIRTYVTHRGQIRTAIEAVPRVEDAPPFEFAYSDTPSPLMVSEFNRDAFALLRGLSATPAWPAADGATRRLLDTLESLVPPDGPISAAGRLAMLAVVERDSKPSNGAGSLKGFLMSASGGPGGILAVAAMLVGVSALLLGAGEAADIPASAAAVVAVVVVCDAIITSLSWRAARAAQSIDAWDSARRALALSLLSTAVVLAVAFTVSVPPGGGAIVAG